MNLILQVLTGSRYGQRIVIGPGEIRTIGRSSAAQHSFDDDDHMSSIHFEVENFGDYAEVRDRRSTNRTWLNSGHISQAKLSHGDRIRAGKTVLGVELEHASMGSSIQHSISQPGSLVVGVATQAPIREPSAPAAASYAATPVPPPVQLPPNEMATPPAAAISSASTVAPNNVEQPRPPLAPAAITPAEVKAAARPEAMPEPPYIKAPYPPAPYAQMPYLQRPSTLPASESGVSLPPRSATPPAPRPASPAGAPPAVHARASQPHTAQPARYAVNSPIESVDLSEFVKQSDSGPANGRSNGPVNNNSPISDSSLWLSSVSSGSGINSQRRFRLYERSGDFQTISHLRSVINTLRLKKTVRILAHFAKIRMETPTNLTQANPVYPDLPAARSHWPVALSYQDWESETVQSVALRLCNNDAIMVLVSEFNTDLDAQIHKIGREGVPGLCEPEGFLGWCWPSAFYGTLMILGSQRWAEVLGSGIEGAIMVSPTHSHKLLAFSADSLAADLEPLGFSSEL